MSKEWKIFKIENKSNGLLNIKLKIQQFKIKLIDHHFNLTKNLMYTHQK